MSDELAKEWLQSKWPNMHACDVDWTMKRYDYPDYVCEYIKNNWIKISDSGGGTYQQKWDYKKCLDETHVLWRTEQQHKMQKELDEEENKPQTVPKIIRDMVQADDGKEMAKLYQQTGFAKAMDDNNKEALKVAAEEGMDAAAKHMMKQAGGDYSRMRSMFG